MPVDITPEELKHMAVALLLLNIAYSTHLMEHDIKFSTAPWYHALGIVVSSPIIITIKAITFVITKTTSKSKS